MGRRSDPRANLDLIAEIRARLPGAVIRSTFLVGFPGETPEDFARLLSFQEDARFDWLGVFPYSREEDTPAFRRPGRVARALARVDGRRRWSPARYPSPNERWTPGSARSSTFDRRADRGRGAFPRAIVPPGARRRWAGGGAIRPRARLPGCGSAWSGATAWTWKEASCHRAEAVAAVSDAGEPEYLRRSTPSSARRWSTRVALS